GGHFGEQEPRGAVTGLPTHRDRLVRGTHTTFPTPDRTAPRERLYHAWCSLFGHVRGSAAVAGVPTHGHRRELRDLEAYVRLELPFLAPACLLRQCRHGQHQEQPGERPWHLSLLSLHHTLLSCFSDTHHSLATASAEGAQCNVPPSLKHFPWPRRPRP